MPKLAPVLLAAIAIAAACQSPSSPAPTDALVGDGTMTPVVHEVYTGFAQPARFTVRDGAHWTGVWARAFEGRSEVPPPPRIDFSREMVLVAAQGARGSSGYDISIDGVSSGDGAITVDVTSTSPAPDCSVLTVITAPVMMVRVPASSGRVRFSEHARTRSCE